MGKGEREFLRVREIRANGEDRVVVVVVVVVVIVGGKKKAREKKETRKGRGDRGSSSPEGGSAI